jgi:hypothetical protein
VRAQAGRKVEVWWSKSREEPGAHKQRHPVNQRQISIFRGNRVDTIFRAGLWPCSFFWNNQLSNGVPPHAADIVDKNLSSRHEYHVVPDSGHFAFLAPCPPALMAQLPQLCVDSGGFDGDVLAFFRAQLLNRPCAGQ